MLQIVAKFQFNSITGYEEEEYWGRLHHHRMIKHHGRNYMEYLKYGGNPTSKKVRRRERGREKVRRKCCRFADQDRKLHVSFNEDFIQYFD